MEQSTNNNSATLSKEMLKVAEVIKDKNNFLIVSHRRPDGDCFGSATALIAGLRHLGKRAIGYNESGIPRLLRFLPFIETINSEMPDWKPDVTIFVDCGSADRVAAGFRPEGFSINIDHHATNSRFGNLNYIDTDACAVGEQILHILKHLDVPITPELATCLYTSVSTDTGNFRYASTTGHTFNVAAELVNYGAKPGWICQQLYESRTPQELDLIARTFSRLRYENEGRFVWSELRKDDYEAVGGYQHEPENLSSEIRGIDGVEISVLFQEPEEGGLRASFRGKGKIDCAALAETLGGGGHPAAAGYSNPNANYEQERARIVELVIKTVGATL